MQIIIGKYDIPPINFVNPLISTNISALTRHTQPVVEDAFKSGMGLKKPNL
jgi:hypothetical protein